LGRKRMKSILISSIYFPPQVGGISRVMMSIAAAMGKNQVCCLTGVPLGKNDLPENSLTKVYRRPGAFAGSKYLQAFGWGAAISEIMIRERPQVVQLSTIYEGSIGLWLRRWLRLPFVIYAHGNEILEAIQTEWEKPRLALRRADRVLANSRFTADLVQKTGVDPKRIEIVHLGCDVDYFRPVPSRIELRQRLLGARYRDRVILTVANLVPRKGHDMVIRCLPEVRKKIREVTYLIVGNGPYLHELEALAEAVGVRDRVIFAGPVADKDLADLYALSDVFVMPSREQLDKCDAEGFGLVFLEANACAKPVVAGRSGGIPDAVADGITGLLVNPHDPKEIADAINRLLLDKELAIRMGKQGRSRVVNEFTWSKCGKRIQEILRSVISERRV
jgi:phosphatidyl-myo-inositol dimannoside synthase